jgi:hypothetical protein
MHAFLERNQDPGWEIAYTDRKERWAMNNWKYDRE